MNTLPDNAPDSTARGARKSDDLQAEVARLRRELESSSRNQRALEESLSSGDGASRRVQLLREALARKDQEILTLKSYQSGHSKQLNEAREIADRLRRERADLEQRLRAREGAFAAIEQQRIELARALDAARNGSDEAVRVRAHAEGLIGEWRTAYDARTRELEAATTEISELRTSLDRVSTALRAALDAAQVAEAKLEAAREAHAIARRALEDELDAEREACAQARADAAAALARAAKAEAARDWSDGELAAMRARLEASEGGVDALLREAQATHARAIEALEAQHAEAIRALHDAMEPLAYVSRDTRELSRDFASTAARVRALAAEVETLRGKLAHTEAALAEAQRDREQSQSDLVDVLAERDTRHSATLRELRERHEEALREALAHARTELDDVRRYFNDALEAQRESHESEIAALNDCLSGDNERVRDLERDLEMAREALGHYAAEAADRLQYAERAAEEALASRERYARKLLAAQREVKRLRSEAPTGDHARVDALSTLLGEVLHASVIALANVAAMHAGRSTARSDDIDEAVSRIAERLPDTLGDLLWNTREALRERCAVSL